MVLANIHPNLELVFQMCAVPKDKDSIAVDPVDEKELGRLLRDVVFTSDSQLLVTFDKALPYVSERVQDITGLMTQMEMDIEKEAFCNWFHRVVETNNCFNFQGFLLNNFIGQEPPRIRARNGKRGNKSSKVMVVDLQKKELLLALFAKKRIEGWNMEDKMESIVKKLFPYRPLSFVKSLLKGLIYLSTDEVEKELLPDGEIAHIFKMSIMAMEDENLDMLLFPVSS